MDALLPFLDILSWPFIKAVQLLTGIAYKKLQKEIFSAQHLLVAHSIRDIAVKLENGGFNSLTRADLDPLALNCSRALATYLKKDVKKISCTIKFCCPTSNPGEKTEVITMGRSQQNSRPIQPSGKPEKKHFIPDNTSFCSILGVYDGETNWEHSLPYFYSPNLARFKKKFKCSRSKHLDYYKTVMVYPLRIINHDTNETIVYGFLTFDSLAKQIFRGKGLVDARKHYSNWQRYEKSIESSALLNFCGSMADNITSTLYPYVQERGTK